MNRKLLVDTKPSTRAGDPASADATRFPGVSAPWDENDPSRAFSAACAAGAAARETTASTRRFTKAIGWFANAFSSPDGAFCHTHAYAEIEAHEAFFIEANCEA